METRVRGRLREISALNDQQSIEGWRPRITLLALDVAGHAGNENHLFNCKFLLIAYQADHLVKNHLFEAGT